MPRDEDQRENLREESNDPVSSIRDYSKSLGKSATALREAAKIFDKTSGKLLKSNQEVKKSIDKLISAFNKYNNHSDNTSGGSGSSNNNNNNNSSAEEIEEAGQQMATDIRQGMRTAFKEGNEGQRKVLSAATDSLRMIAGYAINKFTNAFSTVVNDFESNLTGITVRMQQTNQQYTNMLKESTDYFRSNSLATQFSQIDFTSELQEVLDTGIRGEDAKRMAYSNLINKKLLPALNTSTRAYTRMNKVFGDEFGQSIVSIAKYAEREYGAEGLEEGQLNNLIETIYAQVGNAVIDKGGTAADVEEIMQGTILEYTRISNQYGAQAAESFLSNFESAITDTIAGGDALTIAAADRAGIAGGDLSNLAADTFHVFFEAYKDELGSFSGDSRSLIAAGSQAGLYDTKTAMLLRMGDNFGETSTSWRDSWNNRNNNEYNDQLNNLKNGQYQSLTAQQTKWNENAVAKIADTVANSIPDSVAVLGLISGIISRWFNLWLSGGGGVGNMLGGLLGKGGGGGGLLGKGAGGSGILSKVGAVAPYAAIAAGVIMGGVDAYNSYKSSKDQGLGTGAALREGVNSFVTGHTNTHSLNAEEMSKVANGTYEKKFSWKELGKNTLKGALIGGGIGALAEGIGAVPGAIVGGAVGAITNAIAQIRDAKVYKEASEAAKEAGESMQRLAQVQNEFRAGMNKSKDVQEALNILNNESLKGTEEYNQAFALVKEEYPTYTASLKDASEWNESYSKTIQSVVDIENKLLKQKLIDQNKETSDALRDASYKMDQAGFNKDTKGASAQLAKAITDFGNAGSDLGFTDWMLQNGYDEETAKRLSKEFNQNYVGNNSDNVVMISKGMKGHKAYKKVTHENYWSDYENHMQKRKEELSQLMSWWDNIVSYGLNMEDQYYTHQEVKNFYDALKGYNGRSAGGEDILEKTSLPNYKEVSELAQVEGFKKGIYQVPEDSMLAKLHKDEIVLNASQSNILRNLNLDELEKFNSNLSHGGLLSEIDKNYFELLSNKINKVSSKSFDDFQTEYSKLSDKYGSEISQSILGNFYRATDSGNANYEESQLSSINNLVSVVEDQTKTLSGLLTDILDYVMRIHGKSDRESKSSPVSYSPTLLNYTGY